MEFGETWDSLELLEQFRLVLKLRIISLMPLELDGDQLLIFDVNPLVECPKGTLAQLPLHSVIIPNYNFLLVRRRDR